MTLSEILLWSKLRMRKVDGINSEGNRPIFNYIVDFYCNELKLIIEVDGEIHNLPEQAENDKKGNKILKINGYHVLHFSNYEIEADLSGSVGKIKSFISKICPLPKMDHSMSSNINLYKDNSSPSQGDRRGSQYVSSVISYRFRLSSAAPTPSASSR